MSSYSNKLQEHYLFPQNVGEIKDADGVGEVGNPDCGDMLKMWIKVDETSQTITDVKFRGAGALGCASAVAASSMVTEMVMGKPVDRALGLTKEQIADALDGLPPQKLNCTILAADAIKAAVNDYLERRNRGSEDN